MALIRLVPMLAFVIACGGKSPAPSAPAPIAPAAASKLLVLVDDQGVGLGGNDPIAYAIDKAAVGGNTEHSSQHGGATYRFASAEHKATFDGAPAKHSPQYGGYCAFAASQNRLSEADPAVFQIVDGQLLVFTNADFKDQFNKDVAGNKQKADQNWPGLVERYGK
ncbi:MAG TPA: YHS domain-containing (seleno)protein [Kofleriaceae bacterium]|nr:YHS domain-containing (seleno)protein [Kofleriaceae bacterium]